MTTPAQPTDRTSFVALSLLPLWCWSRAAEQLRSGVPADAVLSSLLRQHYRDKPDEERTLGTRATAALARARTNGIAPICLTDASYPVALTTLVDAPIVLWAGGETAWLHAPAVAIVGSRAASPYGLSVAGQLAGELSAAGVVVVSGLARGIDSAAHRGALDAGGATVAVLGSGVDVIYPPEHASLARDIARSGAVVSELVPGTPPLARFFPQRNRIISGLSRAVVVIEAGERSGSLITARTALEQGREVLAVPGNVLSGRNRGGHGLLRDGAKIVECADDILEELGMSGKGVVSLFRAANHGKRLPIPAPDDPILACLTRGEPSDLDAISERTGLSPSRLLPRLFELELQGAVVRIGGGRFVRP
jgi:DNA processing protein